MDTHAKLIASRKRQRGVTLIEIMIALAVGLILTGGIILVFSSTRQSNRVHEAISRMQETGRMALEIISRDVRMADFWGCSADITNVVNNLDSAGSGYIDFGTGGIAGADGGGTAPDTLVLRGGNSTGLNLEPPYGPQASANVQAVAAGIEELVASVNEINQQVATELLEQANFAVTVALPGRKPCTGSRSVSLPASSIEI